MSVKAQYIHRAANPGLFTSTSVNNCSLFTSTPGNNWAFKWLPRKKPQKTKVSKLQDSSRLLFQRGDHELSQKHTMCAMIMYIQKMENFAKYLLISFSVQVQLTYCLTVSYFVLYCNKHGI